jgi:hypothetical protein
MGLYPTKSLHAIPHKQEYEYLVANLCHLLNVPFIRSQVVDNHWAFSTRSGSPEEGQNNFEQSPLRFPGPHFLLLLLIGSSMPNRSSSLLINVYSKKIGFDSRYCQSCQRKSQCWRWFPQKYVKIQHITQRTRYVVVMYALFRIAELTLDHSACF